MKAKRGSTLFLRTVVVLLGLAVLALCVLVLPAGISATHDWGYRPLLLGMYLPAIPFFVGAYQTWKLLGHIDHNQAFSLGSVRALNIIKYCSAVVGALYAVGLPYMFYLADMDDAPGVLLLGLIFTFAPLAVAAFSAVLQKLLETAIAMKSENELTV